MDGDYRRPEKAEQFAQIRALSAPTLVPWLRDLTMDWAVLVAALAAACFAHDACVTILAMLVVGNRQHALAVLGHEGTHYTVSRNRRLNDGLTDLFCFYPLLMTVTGYRVLHFRHHKLTGTHEDPELLHKKMRAPQWDLPLRPWKVLRYMAADLVGGSLHDLSIILRFSIPQDRRLFYPVVVLHGVFITAAMLTGCWLLPLVWYGALATSFMMFFRIRLWLEHQGTFETQRVALHPVLAALFAPHNIWLHWEHHRFPAIPYHRLKEARRRLDGPRPFSTRGLVDHLSRHAATPSGHSLEAATSEGVGAA